jgi:hypothetical protein
VCPASGRPGTRPTRFSDLKLHVVHIILMIRHRIWLHCQGERSLQKKKPVPVGCGPGLVWMEARGRTERVPSHVGWMMARVRRRWRRRWSEPKFPPLASRRKETRGRPARRQILRSKKLDWLFGVRLIISVAGRDVRRFPVLGFATPNLTHGGGNGAVALVHCCHAGTADDGPWAVRGGSWSFALAFRWWRRLLQ